MTNDLAIFLGIDSTKSGLQLLTEDLVSDEFPSGAKVGGTQKVAQRVALLLLTQKGSKKHDPDFGTSFLKQVKLGSSTIPGLVEIAFAIAVEEIMSYEANNKSENPSERLKSLELLSYDLQQDSLSLSVKIETESEEAEIIVKV